MNKVLNLGKYIFGLTFLVFGALHFMNAEGMAGMAPFGGKIMVYITGVALIAAAISIFIGKLDKLASVLLAVLLLIFIVTIWIPAVSGAADDQAMGMAMSALLKDMGLMGAALTQAKMAKDKSVIG